MHTTATAIIRFQAEYEGRWTHWVKRCFSRQYFVFLPIYGYSGPKYSNIKCQDRNITDQLFLTQAQLFSEACDVVHYLLIPFSYPLGTIELMTNILRISLPYSRTQDPSQLLTSGSLWLFIYSFKHLFKTKFTECQILVLNTKDSATG